MTDLRTAAQQALEALEHGQHTLKQVSENQWESRGDLAMQALHAALAEPMQGPLIGRAATNVPVPVYVLKKAEPVQEPVAWMVYTLDGKSVCVTDNPADFIECRSLPLYTAPPQRKPLTEEEIENAYREIWRDLPSDFDHTSSGWIEQGIKYAERAHGIGDSNE